MEDLRAVLVGERGQGMGGWMMVGFFELTQINVNAGTDPKMLVAAANVSHIYDANGVTVVGFVGGQDVRVREPYEAVAELLQHHCSKHEEQSNGTGKPLITGPDVEVKPLPVGLKELPPTGDQRSIKRSELLDEAVLAEKLPDKHEHKPASRSKR